MEFKRPCLVIMCGVSGSGKTTFAHKHFTATEVVSSDECRKTITDNELNQSCNKDAFELYHSIIEKRIKWGRNVVADATHLTPSSRLKLIEMADDTHYIYAVIFSLSKDTLIKRDANRAVSRGQGVVEAQYKKLEQAIQQINDKNGESSYYDGVYIVNE